VYFIRYFQFQVTEEQANKCEYPVSGSVRFASGRNILVESLIRCRNSGSWTVRLLIEAQMQIFTDGWQNMWPSCHSLLTSKNFNRTVRLLHISNLARFAWMSGNILLVTSYMVVNKWNTLTLSLSFADG